MSPILGTFTDKVPSIITIQAKSQQLRTLEKLFGSNFSINKLADDIYEITPNRMSCSMPAILVNMTMGDLIGSESDRSEEIYYFENSAQFYEKTKELFKIISDEFSFFLNQKLYRGFEAIETKWRISILRSGKLQSLTNKRNPMHYRSEFPDHKFSQYSLGELVDNFLLAAASDNFLKQEWGRLNSSSFDAFLRVRSLRVIDELRFPINAAELKFLKDLRNACMHFRVTTISDYKKGVELINKYLKFDGLEKFNESLGTRIEKYESVAQVIFEFSKNFTTSNLLTSNLTIKDFGHGDKSEPSTSIDKT